MDAAEELEELKYIRYHDIILWKYGNMDPAEEGVSCLSGRYPSERDPHCSANNQQGLYHLKQYSSNFLQYLGDKNKMFMYSSSYIKIMFSQYSSNTPRKQTEWFFATSSQPHTLDALQKKNPHTN